MKHLVPIAFAAALSLLLACSGSGRSGGGDDDGDGDDDGGGEQTWCEGYAEDNEECGGALDAGFVDECEDGLEGDDDFWSCFFADCDDAETCDEIIGCGESC
jgi:hypothetical protein